MKVIHLLKSLHRELCVSVSGGVETMVLLDMLVKTEVRNRCEIRAVHIRDTKGEEVVERYCEKLGVELTVRTSDEERGREVRFEEYRRQGCPIILGSNYEDTVENIIKNISWRKNYKNLRGMATNSFEEGVNVMRPLLETKRGYIKRYADMNDVPYMELSPPIWSKRWKLRNEVIPTIEENEPDFMRGLIKIAEELECKKHSIV